MLTIKQNTSGSRSGEGLISIPYITVNISKRGAQGMELYEHVKRRPIEFKRDWIIVILPFTHLCISLSKTFSVRFIFDTMK
jgi:hypothetical protein